MPKTKISPSKTLADLVGTRTEAGLNQKDFWSPIGVGQSGGSRYETGRVIPEPVAILLILREQGLLSEQMLENARMMIQTHHADHVRT